MAVIRPSWSLDKTSTDIIGVGVGVLHAATSDNVQPLALLAAEKFGTIIPMSHESKAKVFQLCAKDESSAVWNFFMAKIGYQKGDSGWHLSTTDAGLRFLGLAVCLLSIDHWLAADMLRQCIEDTADDKRLIPTTSHLKHLLVVLQPRLVHANFLDAVDGWSTWLYNLDVWRGIGNVPHPDAIAKIIQGMSLLFRVGETDEKSRLEITLPAIIVAWTVAFLKWCLGFPPAIVTANGLSLLDVPACKVLIIVQTTDFGQDRPPLIVRIVKSIDEIQELIALSSDRLHLEQLGMIQLSTHCRSWHRFRPNFKSVAPILPYACYLVLREMTVTPGNLDTSFETTSANLAMLQGRARIVAVDSDPVHYAVADAEVRFGASLPGSSAISVAMQRFLDPDNDERQGSYAVKPFIGRSIRELPHFQVLEHLIRSECRCTECQPGSERRYVACSVKSMFDDLSEAVAFVILIALIEPIEHVDKEKDFLVCYNPGHNPGHDFRCALRALTTPILSILKNAAGPPEFRECSIEVLLNVVMAWLKHKQPEGGPKSWLMSAYNGQVLYPRFFDHVDISDVDLLTLRCIAGTIIWNNEKYNIVLKGNTDMEREPDELDVKVEDMPLVRPITSPRDEYRGFKVEWHVATLERGLVVTAAAPLLTSSPDRNPMNAIITATNCCFVRCPHDNMTALPPRLLQNVTLRDGPVASPCWNLMEDFDIAVTLTDRNEAARFFAVCSKEVGVIRNDACLTCCVNVCLLLGIRLIIC